MKLANFLVIITLVILPYFWNAAKLFSCDFEAGYRCEMVHAVGVVLPPLALVSVWFAVDEED